MSFKKEKEREREKEKERRGTRGENFGSQILNVKS